VGADQFEFNSGFFVVEILAREPDAALLIDDRLNVLKIISTINARSNDYMSKSESTQKMSRRLRLQIV